MCAGGSLEDGQRTSGQLVRLKYAYFVFTVKDGRSVIVRVHKR